MIRETWRYAERERARAHLHDGSGRHGFDVGSLVTNHCVEEAVEVAG